MSILQRRQKSQERGDGNTGSLAKRNPDGGGIGRLADYRRQIDKAFERLWRDFEQDPLATVSALPARLGSLAEWPAVDIAEDDKAVTFRVDVPGLDPNDINVEVSGNLLTIRGQRADEWTEKQRGVRRRERVSGSFARTITLPSYVDASKAEASYQNGTLTITIPKTPGKEPKHVPVTAS
jgi:HSP20 family protein